MSVAVALRMRSGLGIQFLCVKPTMPHNVVHVSASEGSKQQGILAGLPRSECYRFFLLSTI